MSSGVDADGAGTDVADRRWLTRGVGGIGAASLLADVGHEVPTALLPSLLTSTLGAPAAALGLIEGVSDALAGGARFAGGALADDPSRRRRVAVGGYTTTAVLASLTGAATGVWQVAVLRAGAWTARGLRVPARNALLADVVHPSAYGRAYGFERMMDNLGAVFGPLLALGLVAAVGVRWAIGLSVIPGLLAAAAIVYAIRHTARPATRAKVPLRFHIQPVLRGDLGRLMTAVAAFEVGNVAATLLILRATELLTPTHGATAATSIALLLYTLYNLAATAASVPAGRTADRLGTRGPIRVLTAGSACSWPRTSGSRSTPRAWSCLRCRSLLPVSVSAASRRPSTQRSPRLPRHSFAGPRLGCSPPFRPVATWSPARSRASCGRLRPRPSRSATWLPGC